MAGWVVCASCGTRIKAGRGHCLRCLAELPDAGAPAQTTIWESLGLSQRDGMILAIALAAIVLTLVGIFSFTQQDAMDDVARPLDVPVAAVAKPPVRAPDDSQVTAPGIATTTTPAYEPATFLDSTRGGGAAFTSGDFASARSAYERALLQQPDNPETLTNLGQVLVRLGRVDEAVVRFERAAVLVPAKSSYHFNLAHALAQSGNLDRAIVQYRQAAKLFPTDYASQYNLAMALHKKGDEPAAIAEFQRAISLAPGDASFHVSLAISLEKVGRIAEALREYRTSLQMDPAAPGADQLKAHIEALSALAAKTPTVP